PATPSRPESSPPAAKTPQIVSLPPSQYHSPSLSRSPLLTPGGKNPRTPRIRTPNFITPLGSPLRKAIRLTRLDPQDAWLPITESRNGNAYYAAYHTLCSGIGIQALLHESPEDGVRYSRYMQLASATFGEKLSKLIVAFPIINLSAGTCVALIVIGGSTSRMFYTTLCGPTRPLSNVEWYLIFTCAAVVLSQLPNLNSIAGVSLIGALTAVGYCTGIWAVSVAQGSLPNVSYNPVTSSRAQLSQIFDVMNALGIIAFAFRGHNLILEIQATMPSSEKHPSTIPMWRGVKASYSIIATCLFPLAIGGYWAYGHMIPANGGMLTALYAFHSRDIGRPILGLISCFVIVNALSSFQLYGMPMFDDMESNYTRRFKKPCPWWLRAIIRAFFGFVCFFIAVAVPFLGSVAGLVGGISLPVTLAYPCFMWIKMKRPKKFSPMWWVNTLLGLLGMGLSCILTAAGIYVVVDTGVQSTNIQLERMVSSLRKSDGDQKPRHKCAGNVFRRTQPARPVASDHGIKKRRLPGGGASPAELRDRISGASTSGGFRFFGMFFPNLNSLAIGSVTAVFYCFLLWIISLDKGRVHEQMDVNDIIIDGSGFRNVLTGLGIIALAFRGHNLVLEIQGTIPTNRKKPSSKSMWRGVTFSSLIIAMCMYPIAILGHWAYGNKISSNLGILTSFVNFHHESTSKYLTGAICLAAIIHYICAFQMYSMPALDNFERIYVTEKNKPCSRWVRAAIKALFGGFTYFMSVVVPFLPSLGLFVGSMALPLTLSYPCLMWVAIRKSARFSRMWCLNAGLGIVGIMFCVLSSVGAMWSLIADGLDANFFKPK
ncbi:amino acid transporter, partial [Striga asiatica]